MIIKCKMCGGDIQFNPGDTCGQCDHCGCTTTFPKLPNEQRTNLFNRANHFRRQCEFDKAMAAYEHILEEDDTDAEAHWGIVLSKFGIEYVEDPVTHERIPTCHRAQVISILSDEDYQNALKYAPDTYSREIYEKEAKRIAEIQKGILAISSKEEPYDVFICYKETDDSGNRTKDSTLAQEIYYQLTNEGYKVFFSRITLEDKLGQEYEPYIFAALNSAKVMLVVGTKPEHFSAVWVKNEWSRFLAIMKNDRKRVLIPCYRDMDPYDLPEELSALQSQDMSKIGFIQDLIHGVRKVLDIDKKAEQPRGIQQVVQPNESGVMTPGVTSLMQRTYLFLEDGDFSSAAEYLDRVLDIDPQFAPAYAAKVCVAFGLHKEADLAETTFQYEDNPDWQKAIRFADQVQKTEYTSYAAKVKERVTRQIRDYAYDCAVEMAVLPGADRGKLDAELAAYSATCTRSTGKRADGSRRVDSRAKEEAFNRAVKAHEPSDVSESNLKTAAAMFEAIGDAEASERAKQCCQLAERARQKAVYQIATSMLDSAPIRPSELEKAARKLLTIPDYKDAKVKAQACMDKAETIRSGLYDSAVRAMSVAGRESRKWDVAQKKLAEDELNGYRDVDQLRSKAAKTYEECVAIEQEAKRRSEERRRREAEAAAVKKKRIIIVGVLATVMVVTAVIVATLVIIPGKNYRNAVALQQAGKYMEAIEAFEALNGYGDSTAQIEACRDGIRQRDYQAAIVLQQAGKYREAIEAFEALNGYSDSTAQIEACRDGIRQRDYQAAIDLQQAGKYEEAIEAFMELGNYSDAESQVMETRYLQAKNLVSNGNYDGAVAIFTDIRGYKDVDSLLSNDQNLVKAVKNRIYAVGNYVNFGHYPHGSDGNDNTDIEWVILAKNGYNALLISRYGLDAKPYNDKWVDITWEKSTLRSWLNEVFLNKAFTEQEKKCITLTNVNNDSSQCYSNWSTNGGNNTQDSIFLLSYAEANDYFDVMYDDNFDSTNMKSRVEPTEYAIKQGAYTPNGTSSTAGWWWLRSPGDSQDTAAYVSFDGLLNCDSVIHVDACVRPALWINLETLISGNK